MNDKINELIESLERLMYGHNYKVCIGIDVFKGNSETEFRNQIKLKYPKTNPENCPLTKIEIEYFWQDIKDKHDYRGDDGAGLKLSIEKEKNLKLKLEEYYNYIEQHFDENTKYFYYNDPDGIPGYPVFWEYRYVAMNKENKIIFIYGSSSD
jgi:hypothetical protein